MKTEIKLSRTREVRNRCVFKLPFGEDLGAGTGGRTTGMGYSGGSSDNNRKKFTGYERDAETSLDFAQARYYANAQGRFTSPDPFSASAIIADPQTFNRYAYCRNNPVNSVDPSGMSANAPTPSSFKKGKGGKSFIKSIPAHKECWNFPNRGSMVMQRRLWSMLLIREVGRVELDIMFSWLKRTMLGRSRSDIPLGCRELSKKPRTSVWRLCLKSRVSR